MCEAIYTSGKFPNIGTWSDWTDGDCSDEDCYMTQNRTCTTGNNCVGSTVRRVPCSSVCIPPYILNMNEGFIR